MSTFVKEMLERGSRRITRRFQSDAAGRHVEPSRNEPCNPRIVILSASVGSGHVRAAEAIQAALEQLLPNATIAHVDVLGLTNRAFGALYGKGYFRAVQRVPNAVRMMYDLLDHPAGPRRGGRRGAAMRLALERLNFARVTRFLSRQRWDLAINTHFLPPELIAWMRRSGRIDLPQVTVVTDFDVHGMWINQPCERYFVACEEARARIIASGADAGRVGVSGIPISPVFALHHDARQCRRKHGLALDRPVILQLVGGFGIGSIQRTYRSICEVSVSAQIVVVTGKNTQAREQLEAAAAAGCRHRCKVIGYTNEMHELMAAADVVVSKPGGLTASEALAKSCPMVIVEPIPGQEDRNSDYLLENGCAVKVNNPAVLTHKLTSLLLDGQRLARMRQSARRYARPLAALHVAAGAIEVLRARQGIESLAV